MTVETQCDRPTRRIEAPAVARPSSRCGRAPARGRGGPAAPRPLLDGPDRASSDLNVYYGAFRAVRDVSLTIPPRAVTAIIGPSGCGKSTFLRTLNRMHELIPDARVEG